MGWSVHSNTTLKAMIEYLTKEQGYDEGKAVMVTLAKSLRGFTLWAVQEIRYKDGRNPTRFIACYLLKRYGASGDVGYKGMTEACGPYEKNCPLSYLDMAPVERQEWRDEVRAYHAVHSRKLRVGERVELPGCTPNQVVITHLKPLVGEHNGMRFRIKRSLIGKTVPPPSVAAPDPSAPSVAKAAGAGGMQSELFT